MCKASGPVGSIPDGDQIFLILYVYKKSVKERE